MKLALIALVLLLAMPPGRAWATTLLLLPDLLNLGGVRPLVLVSGAPTRRERALAGATADLYRAQGGGRRPALVLTLGVHPLDKRTPVVERLCESLARAGLHVLIVQSDDLVADRIVPEEPVRLAAAFELLAAEPSVDPARIGIFGFSAGASLAFLAATQPTIADRVRLVGWLGGYVDAARLAREVAEGSYDDDGRTVGWQPHELTRYVFRKQLVDSLADPTDRALLTAAYVDDFGRGDSAARAVARGLDDALSSPPAQRRQLDADARDLVALFEGDSSRGVPPSLATRLDAVSPLHAIWRFRARAHVLVDRSDPLVPYTHSRDLARSLSGARYAEFDLFEHVQPTKPLPPLAFAAEAFKLAAAVATILSDLE